MSVHKTCCMRLLGAIESLQQRIDTYSTRTPMRSPLTLSKVIAHPIDELSLQRLQIQRRNSTLCNAHSSIRQHLTRCFECVGACFETNTLQKFATDIRSLSNQLTLLWKQFLEMFRSRYEVCELLVEEFHQARVGIHMFCTSTLQLACRCVDWPSTFSTSKAH